MNILIKISNALSASLKKKDQHGNVKSNSRNSFVVLDTMLIFCFEKNYLLTSIVSWTSTTIKILNYLVLKCYTF